MAILIRVFAAMVTLGILACRAENDAPVVVVNTVTMAHSILANGDVVFRRTDGLLGDIVLGSDSASEYTHVGIIQVSGRGVFVVHATPAEDAAHLGGVVVDSFDKFVGDAGVSRVAVYRLRSGDLRVAQQAVAWAIIQAQKRIPFDGKFDLSDSTAMYCTELVWRGFRSAGVSLTEPAATQFRIPLIPDTLILVSDIVSSPLLERVAASPF